jgi:hypothetical protein
MFFFMLIFSKSKKFSNTVSSSRATDISTGAVFWPVSPSYPVNSCFSELTLGLEEINIFFMLIFAKSKK